VQAAGAVLRMNYSATNAASVQVPNDAALARLRNNPRVLAVVASRAISLHQGRGGNGGGGGGGGSTTKPKAPTSLSAAATSSSAISLSWTDTSNNETGFSIERCTGAGCNSFSAVAQVGANVATYSNSGLNASTTYRYRVAALNSAGSSKYSNTAEATTLAPPPPPPQPPTAPSGLSAQAVSSSQINLAWSDNSSNESGFRIERCQNSGCGSFQEIAVVGANVAAYSSLGLASETTYAFRVRAYNNDGNSSYSNTAEGTTASSGTQVVPEGIQRIGASPGTLSVTGVGVGVAIVDTGLNFSHPDLGMAPEVPGVNSFNGFTPGASCEDIHGHGTHVGGIVAARNNSMGVVGVAPDATLYCVNVFQPDPVYEVIATDESLIAGLDWIATHANQVNPPIRVVNMSLGRDKTPEDTPNHPLHLAVKSLYELGISVVVSAGNDSTLEVSTQIPASYPEVMAVASTTAVDGVNGYDDLFVPCAGEQNILADTASYFTTDGAFVGGSGVTVSAPGATREDIFDYLGTCFVESYGILSTWPGGETVELSGTSMAAPHVAGVVALMWQKLGAISPENARARIRNNVARWGTAPLDSAVEGYTFDGEREGILWAPSAVDDVPPPPPDSPPTVLISSPADGATFGAASVISFQGSATDPEQGNLSGSLVWRSDRDGQIGTGASFSRALSNGNHTITASVTDAGGNVVRSSVDITVGSSDEPGVVSVVSITYISQGTDLLVDAALRDEFGAPVAGAVVSADIFQIFYGFQIWHLVATTNAQGVARFRVVNAPPDGYSTTITDVDAPGMTWDGITPFNWSWH